MRSNAQSLPDALRREERNVRGQLSAFRHTRQRGVGIVDLPDKRWVDVFDAAQKTSLMQHQEVLLNRLSQKSRALAEAQERVQDGAYGICAGCGCRIPARRLKAMPTATLCVACQERREAIVA
jgi:RNA polymerase-binding transcription factor DksA